MKKKYYKFDLNTLTMNILCVILFVICFVLYILIKPEFVINTKSLYFVVEMSLLILYFLIHEILHGIGYGLFAKNRKNIKYGAVLEKGVFYAMCQEEINKKAILISLLFPTIFLTFITLPIAYIFNIHFLAFLSITNFAGAIGDLCMVMLVLKMPSDIKYIDYDNSIGATFISSHDLSKIKSVGLKFVESGDPKKKKVDESIKKIYVSKSSIIILCIYLGILLIDLLIYLK